MIKLHGIMQYLENGHKYIDVLVTEDQPDVYVRHRVGVDMEVNRGNILTFLASLYDLKPGEIIWPRHISLKMLE